MTPLPDASGQLTGTQPGDGAAAGLGLPGRVHRLLVGPVNSGGIADHRRRPQYPLATVSCSDFVQHLGATGFGETAMAADSVVGTDQAYDQVIYQFSTASAASAFVAGIAPLAGRCPSFTASR